MNFRVSIKQLLARICIAEKKKDLKVTIDFKKELIPFLLALRREGIIYKFTAKKKTITLCLKKTKVMLQSKQKQKVLRVFDSTAITNKNPTALVFLSTTLGIYINRILGPKAGGPQLFLVG
jgi:hypothetical protein